MPPSFDIETLATVPLSYAGQKLIAADSNDIRSRHFNLLRAQLLKKVDQEGTRLIGVTSAAPGAGKSFVASNVAVSLGMLSNKITYLVDLDLRRASIADIFGIETGAGLTEFLSSDDVRLEKIGRKIGSSNLVVLPTFPAMVNSAELMVGKRFEALMTTLRSLGDDAIVIIDLPPIFANDDAMLVASHLDGLLMVIEQGVTTKRQLESALRFIAPTKLIGTIFNRADGGDGDAYGYSGRYQDYYSKK